MTVLRFPSAVGRHEPWPSDRVVTASDQAVLTRAATLVGIPSRVLPLPLRWGPGPAQLAVLRVTAELLLSRLEESTGACPDCAGSDLAMECARELGKLEARLDALARDAELVLGWMAAPTER
ncbi:hypothetical protein E9529_04475 [Blastococcus sp. KM273128]|uniref:hypothetical protein n=1 Tax=Blastococcus sp. KM273128 TaxID=2570314 RepID=UPI001F182A74|nr:hypothetical protein [Blastococcus sp. KM273128]MCF6743539.1 hypothetical protein [Blastococcus sp. KM273128]